MTTNTTYPTPTPQWMNAWAQEQTMATHADPAFTSPQDQIVPAVENRPELSVAGTRRLDQGRYWVGATLTAAIAALTGVIGMVIAEGIFGVDVLIPDTSGSNALHIGTYGLVIAALTLLGALLFDGMVHIAPRPILYFRWLFGLLTALTAVLPFTSVASLTSQVVLAGVNILVGALILALVPLAATRNRQTT